MKEFFKDTKPGGQLLALFLIFVVLFIIATGVLSLATLMGADATGLAGQCATQVAIFAGSAFLFVYMFYGSPTSFLRLAPSRDFAMRMLAAVAIILCVIPLSDWLGSVNDSWHLPAGMEALEATLRQVEELSQGVVEGFLLRDGIGVLLANLIVLALVPAVCEELFFRGAMQQLMHRWLRNPHIAILLTAMIFSLFHGEFFAFVPRFFLGIVLGYLYFYGGSLWVNVVAHFANNAVVVVLYFLCSRGVLSMAQVEHADLPWYVVVAALLVAVTLFSYVFVHRRKSCGEES